MAKFGDGLRNRVGYGVRLPDIARHEKDIAPSRRAHFRSGLRKHLTLAANDANISPARRERLRDATANAGAAAGHERDMSSQKISFKYCEWPGANFGCAHDRTLRCHI